VRSRPDEKWFRDGVNLFIVEWDNIRAALQRAVDTDMSDDASTIIGAVVDYAFFSSIAEVADWSERARDITEPTPPILGAAGFFALTRGYADLSRDLAQRATDSTGQPVAAHAHFRQAAEMAERLALMPSSVSL
jgi:hypothetical protein